MENEEAMETRNCEIAKIRRKKIETGELRAVDCNRQELDTSSVFVIPAPAYAGGKPRRSVLREAG
jgi:hypothetical protein